MGDLGTDVRLLPNILCFLHIIVVLLYILNFNTLNYETVVPAVFVSLHPHRQESLLSTWPLTEDMWRLSVCCSRLELTLILGTKYVSIHIYVYGVPAENTMLGEFDGHVHCTEGLVPLCFSFILGNQFLIGKAKLDFACYQEYIRRERDYRIVHTCEQTLCTMERDMHVRNLHTTTCNLLVNFTTPTHSVSFKFTSRLQVYSFTKFSHICTEYTQCLYVCSYAQIDTLSLSLCTLDTPCVLVVSCNLIFCCVIQINGTPLYWASFSGHTEIVAMLLKFGADFNSCSKVSTSYFITPISAVSEYVDVYTT